ncbi:MAG: uroporphyrinogen decarboxylase family protein, partial [Lentisphaeria bacterium]|nr:uroporphyrinogen decarboxylase family protein [Lentisphaeria bacterium]
MPFNSSQFIQRILSSRRRLAIPIMTAPAMRQLGISASDAYRSGELQAQCLKAVADDGRADACTAFMDLSVEAEAFGCPVTFAEDEIPNVTAPILGD